MTFRRTQVKYKATRTSRSTYYSLLIGDYIVAMFISTGRDVHMRSVSRGGVVADKGICYLSGDSASRTRLPTL